MTVGSRREPAHVTAGTVFHAAPEQGDPRPIGDIKMLAWTVLAATAPALLCLGASAFLAYKERAQWIWFAAFSVVAGFGGLTVLQTIGAWRLAAQG